jgi:hypothetical protein
MCVINYFQYVGAVNYSIGFYAYFGGNSVRCWYSAFSDNGNGISSSHGSYLYAYQVGITGNATGILGTNMGRITTFIATPNGNSVEYSPTVNTLTTANNFALIGDLV